MPKSPVDWIWYPDEGFYSSQCAQYYGSSRRFDQKGSQMADASVPSLSIGGGVEIVGQAIKFAESQARSSSGQIIPFALSMRTMSPPDITTIGCPSSLISE